MSPVVRECDDQRNPRLPARVSKQKYTHVQSALQASCIDCV